MILPTTCINFSQSLLGFGAYILSQLNTPKSVDTLWQQYMKDYHNNHYPAKQSFDNLVMTLIFLYSVSSVTEKAGVIEKCV